MYISESIICFSISQYVLLFSGNAHSDLTPRTGMVVQSTTHDLAQGVHVQKKGHDSNSEGKALVARGNAGTSSLM